MCTLDSKFQVAVMYEEIVNIHIILEFVYEKNTKINPPKSLEIKISKIGFHSLLSWSKVDLEAKFHEAMTFSGWENLEQN